MQMSAHQHRKLERGRESAEQPSNQLLNNKKSAGASDWVKRKLNQHIRNKHRKPESQDPAQLSASNIPESHYFEEDSPLRRTASEPILKLRPKRSASGRQNPLQRKTSAPPTVREPDSMGGTSSSTTVFKGRSLSDKKMSCQEPQTFSTSSPHEDESPVHSVQNPMIWTRYSQPVFAVHPPVLAVPGQWAVMPHRPLSKSQSAPSFVQHFHTQTVMIAHPMYQQQWPQETFQHHTETNEHLHASTQISVSHALSHRLVFDYQMLKHVCDCGGYGDRIVSIWTRLLECGLRNQCKAVKGRLATFEELLSVHSEELVCLYTGLSERTSSIAYRSQTDLDTASNTSCSAEILKMAVGSVIELALRVAGGELRNGFAVVTHPGHHASHSQTCGSSIFNSVAIAAKQLQERLKVKKILIVDWDVHHGYGTEEIFYTDPSVLYISLHRYDNGSFFCGNGQPTRVGSDRGEGYNVNVA
ncbi:Histone deacetylase 4 [Labeo rohita]|uniref:Histone deacetylase 4 n=1 Tax=Labeo rohita TaxID=84645 RepID=A0ABQ8MLF5_LABRO|nr:Histone deacetylase 4 [Labeo rohita]